MPSTTSKPKDNKGGFGKAAPPLAVRQGQPRERAGREALGLGEPHFALLVELKDRGHARKEHGGREKKGAFEARLKREYKQMLKDKADDYIYV